MVTHLLRTHLFMEPIAVASYRQLPTIHPVWKLLAPHIRGVLAINTLGRDVLIAEGGVADNTLTVGGGGKTITHSVNLSPGRSNYQVSGLNFFLTHVKKLRIFTTFFLGLPTNPVAGHLYEFWRFSYLLSHVTLSLIELSRFTHVSNCFCQGMSP